LLLGIAHLAALPPWEGFDETAHYAYIQYLADVHDLPPRATAVLSTDVEAFEGIGPTRYKPQPPFDPFGTYSYRTFFAAPDDVIVQAGTYLNQPPPEPRRYVPARRANWQSQHPPLYYLLMAPLYLATKGMNWVDHLLLVRMASYLMACAALVVGVHGAHLATNRYRLIPDRIAPRARHGGVVLGIALWPVLFPMWIPEMARLGNDSLSALIVALVWLRLVHLLGHGDRARDYAWLGVILGCGLLTKVLFAPIAFGVGVFLAARAWRRLSWHRAGTVLMVLAVLVAVTVGIGGWWYVGNFLDTGSFVGSTHFVRLGQAGGVAMVLDTPVTAGRLLEGLAVIAMTFVWGGTWSFAWPNYAAMVGLALVPLVLAGAYGIGLRRARIDSLTWLPVFVLVPVAIAIVINLFVKMALYREGFNVPGWYLHLLAVPLGAALGIGIAACWPARWFRLSLSILGGYALAFAAWASASQVLLYTGFAIKAGDRGAFRLAPELPSIGDLVAQVGERLAVIASPNLAAAAFAAGAVLLVVGSGLAWRGYATLESDST